MSNFTPGPWRFEELRGDDGLGYIASDIAEVPCGHIFHAGVRGLSADENRANALLAAAAPDMLAMLIEIAESMQAPGLFAAGMPHDMRTRARAIIARASAKSAQP